MKKTINLEILEYFSLLLVLSFYIFNNIYFVLGGILLALYFIYKNNAKSNNTEIQKNQEIRSDKIIESHHINNKEEPKESILSLAEEIEELGIIPSFKSEKDKNVA